VGGRQLSSICIGEIGGGAVGSDRVGSGYGYVNADVSGESERESESAAC